MKKENTKMHPFEKAGLGKAPFKYVGVEIKSGPLRFTNPDGTETQVGAPGQPMGCCKYCYQGIKECHIVRSADGKVFEVGCDCIQKLASENRHLPRTAEQAQLEDLAAKANASRRDLRNQQARDRRAKAAQASAVRLDELLGDKRLESKLSARPSKHDWKAKQGGTEWDDVLFTAHGCGHAGRLRLIA